MSESKEDNENVPKEETITISKKEYSDMQLNINQMKQAIEAMKQPQQIAEPQQKSNIMNNPFLLQLLQNELSGKGESDNQFGTKQNMEFFANVGMADFNLFRQKMMRRFLKEQK